MRKPETPRPIALLMPRANVHSRRIIRGVTRYARPFKAWDFHVGLPDSAGIARLKKHPPAGVIATLPDARLEKRLLKLGLPLVNCSSDLSGGDACRVVIDNPAVGQRAAEHLLGLGLRSLAYVGDGGGRVSDDRGRAFLAHGHAAGARTDRWDLPSPADDPATGREANAPRNDAGLCDWLAGLPKPVGVLACHDAVGVTLCEACRRVGLRVPTQVTVLGVDNDPVLCGLAYPSLSSIQTPQEQLGFEAARRLDELMRGRKVEPRELRLGAAGVVARQSTTAARDLDGLADAALRFISEHADLPIRVGDVVRHVGGSRRNLELRFQRVSGRGVLDAIQQAHIALARRLLAETDMTIEQVAEAAGFNSRERFSIVFRQCTGRSPRQAYPAATARTEEEESRGSGPDHPDAV